MPSDEPRSATSRWRRQKEPIKYVIKDRKGKRAAFTVDEETGGWNSTASPTGNGYRGMHGKPAHRDAYERWHAEIPNGFECHHMCGNRECVNFDHIIAVSKHDHRKIHRFIRGKRSGE